ncbi:MAG TPA: RNA polymerase sigma factor [Bryobacteraceae bacterium]|nr:RNA polymerase sigma factor [Bryobacteraceae bacterium]
MAAPLRQQTDLRDLLLRYQQGDTAAAAELVRAASPMLLRFCLGQGDTRDEVEDVLQEIWLRIHRARHTYRPENPAEPWLYAIARYTRLDARRRRSRFRAREVQVDPLPEVAAASPPDTASTSMAALLAVLPPGQREVLLLLKGCGMSLEEVARATCSTVGAVKQKAHRAYERLRAAVGGVQREAAE